MGRAMAGLWVAAWFMNQINYIVFYRESPELVEVVNVIHARRQWPPKRSKA